MKIDKWKQALKLMKLHYLNKTANGFFIASGGYSMQVKNYSDKTANALTRAIEDFIKFSGGYCNRISTTGLMRKINGQLKWTKGNSNKGAADVRILYKGFSIDAEIKIGNDVQSEAQVKEQQKIIASGGKYWIIKTFPDFLELWQNEGFEIPEYFEHLPGEKLKELIKL